MWTASLFAVVMLSALTVAKAEDKQDFALKYLNQFQYLSMSRSGNHDVKQALRSFQSFAGLNVTGRLDRATVKQMKKPRCGMPDGGGGGGDRLRRYATYSKWRRTHLTYFIQHGRDLSQGQQDRIFAKALKYWADVSGLSFEKVRSPRSADLKISFGTRRHGGTSVEGTCGSTFDGPGRVLAHAYFPSDGRAHFDEDETYTDGTSRGTNLLWVATHEFGHSLGLKHSDVRGAIMYPYYTGYVHNMKLHSDDIRGIQSLYGSGSGGGGGGGCSDKDNRCRYWTRYCRSNAYVQRNCKKTCRLPC